MKKLCILLCALTLASCGEEPKQVQKPKTGLTLQKTTFAELSNFENDNTNQLRDGFQEICARIMRMRTPYIANAEIMIKTQDYQNACKNYSHQNFKQFIKDNFDPYLVKYDDLEFGKFTSYYEAAIKAATKKDNTYKYPIYGKPNDLVEFNPNDFDENITSQRFVGRIDNGKLMPYYNRAYIENQGIDAPIILWSDNLVDIHIMQIQGSAVAQLPDGTTTRIGYADNNGKPFKGIGSILLEKGLLQPGQVSMGSIREWLNQNPEKAKEIMQENHRFIFHRILDARGPIGAMGLPLTDGRSMAIDPKFIPLGSLMWLETVAPNRQPIQKLVIAQDVGSAIKGPIRGDYYWGSGDEVLDQAGKMNASGRYFILLPKAAKHEQSR